MRLLLALPLCGCMPDRAGGDEAPVEEEPLVPESAAYAEEAAPISCADEVETAALLTEVLMNAGIRREDVGYDAVAWSGATYADVLDDPFLLPWFRETLWEPLSAQCVSGQLAADLDHALSGSNAASVAIGEAMERLGVLHDNAPISAPSAPREELADLDEELAQALTYVLDAMDAVADARKKVVKHAPGTKAQLVDYGHGGVAPDYEVHPALESAAVQEWVLADDGPRALYEPARQLAVVLEHVDLARFAGTDVTLDVVTSTGRVVLSGPGDDEPEGMRDVALYVDFGGDDTYTHPAGANTAEMPAAVHVDLGGNDVYTYDTSDAGTGDLLPADADGRYRGDENLGTFSLSKTGRQGSGRLGVGFLFDLGGGSDHYQSLRMSQGYGHMGVGVLLDDGGDDTYLGEDLVQGAASMGIGLFLDQGGNDAHETFAHGQGFAFVQGVGFAADGGGNDTWLAHPGLVDGVGTLLFSSAQMPGEGASSFSQGAGYGLRGDASATFLSGGLGVLRDAGGDDTYTAGVFAQGTGYWQGTGMLLDGDGSDAYDSFYYAQGGAAHYSIGILMDDGEGDDTLNLTLTPRAMQFGAGHDFSLGLFVNEKGDDDYRFSVLAAGASNCQGMGIMADNDGVDTYSGDSSRAIALGNYSDECNSATRRVAPSIGLFLDSGADADTYATPVGANDTVFGHKYFGAEDEFGGGVDGDGETALHASGVAP